MKLQCYRLKVRELCRLYRTGRLDLNPPYQRRPAWASKQRRELIGSIFNGIPVPAVIFYRIPRSGRRGERFEVMDGKQRIETILHFRYGGIIAKEPKLGFLLRRDESKKRTWFFYDDLTDGATRSEFNISVSKFLDYQLPVIEYSGELVGLAGQKIAEKEIFAKINSTGSRLTANEIRHAQSTPFFEVGTALEAKWRKLFVERWRVFSKAEVSRYQYHEFMLELATVVLHGGISDKRKELERWMRDDIPIADLRRAQRDVSKILKWMRAILRDGDFGTTRFGKKADFYSLFSVLAKLGLRQHAVMVDRKLNRLARTALVHFSQEANDIDHRIKKYLSAKLSVKDRHNARYIIATREGTDQMRNREARNHVLSAILEPVFAKRRSRRRGFELNVKQLLWHKSAPRGDKIRCPNPNENPRCFGRISFEDCQVDHRLAHVRGGETAYQNAQLLCPSCNRSKGAR